MINNPQTQLLKYLPTLAMVGFTLGTAYTLSQITWLMLVEEKGEQIAIPVGSDVGSTSPRLNNNLGYELSQWNLFGVAKKEKQIPEKQLDVKAPDTRLQLTLKGVYVAPEADSSSAIIADKRGAQRYRIGDKIPGGVTLHQVKSKYVILKRGARFETLRFTEASLKSPIVAKPVSRAFQRKNPRSGRRGVINDIRSGRIATVDELLNDYGANPAEQFASVLVDAGMEPTNEGGEAGLKVGSSAPKDILKAIGLRPGDIVRTVNDFPVNELQGDDVLLREILTSERAKIVIQRGSRRFTVNYPLPKS